MKIKLTLSLFIAAATFAVQAESTTCTFGEKQRKIEVVYPENSDVACEVQYTKDGNMTVLWSARAEQDYCAPKATAFIEKQQGWGWQCESDPTVTP